MKKNIAIMISSLLGGGAERVAATLADEFVKRGDGVFIFVDRYDKKKSYSCGGRIIPLNISVSGELYEKHPNIAALQGLHQKVLKMRQLKKQYEIDVSISFMEEFNYINVLSRQKDRVILRVCTILSERDEMKHHIFYQKYFLKHLYNKADKIVVMTRYARQDMIKNWGVRKELLELIPNPVKDRAGELAELEKPEWIYGGQSVVSVGRLEEVKQHWHLIRAFSRVASRLPEADLLLLGHGTKYSYLKTLSSQYGLNDRVHFLGFVRNVWHFMENGAVYVLTSKTEGFPNSMTEALSMGLPVVSVDCKGAPREILAPGTKRGENGAGIQYARYGVLVPALDGRQYNADAPLTQEEERLAEALYELLTSEERRAYYKEAGRRCVKRYQMDRIMEMWDRIM